MIRTRFGLALVGFATFATAALSPRQSAAAPVEEGGRNRYGVYRWYHPQRFIPLTRPDYIPARKAKLPRDAPVIGLEVGDDVRCFPIRQIWYHHIVNDEIGGEKLAVTYCIMSNTAVVYRLEDVDQGLQVAGLFGGVLVLGRIGGENMWAQIAPVPVPGHPCSETLALGPSCVIAPWGRWKAAHPNTKVLAPLEDFDLYYKAYDRKPKGYNVNPLMNETVAHTDSRLGPGVEVLGVAVGDKSKAYPLKWLEEKGRVADSLGGRKFTAVWDKKLETARVEEPFDGLWMRAYWYGWSSFYPGTAVAGLPAGAEK